MTDGPSKKYTLPQTTKGQTQLWSDAVATITGARRAAAAGVDPAIEVPWERQTVPHVSCFTL
jgi:hypothetical protein